MAQQTALDTAATPVVGAPGTVAALSSPPFLQFVCRACGWVYDEAKGDPDGGLPPGTRFDDIPDDWSCPLCGVSKADFEPWTPPSLVAARGANASSSARSSQSASRRAGARPGHATPVVVVGGGTAAWSFIEALRALDADRPITLVSACRADRYEKPRLSVAHRLRLAAEALCTERAEAAAQRLGVRLLPETHAVRVLPEARALRTTRGVLRYTDLVLAHGAVQKELPSAPAALAWRINDLGAYERFRAALDRASQALGQPARVGILGAGLVGCELGNDLALAGHPVTLVDRAARPLSLLADEGSSQDLLDAWRKAGLALRFIGGCTVASAVRQPNGSIQVLIEGAAAIEVDLLVSALGLATPSRLATTAGLRFADGIVLDPATLQTGVAGVHALGDCVSVGGAAQRYIEPIARQAAVIARRICGLDPGVYDARPPLVRVKTTTHPLRIQAPAACR